MFAPLFLFYDYTFRPPSASRVQEELVIAHEAGIVCSDEHLHPDPYLSRKAWCRSRLAVTETRLAACDPALPTVRPVMQHHADGGLAPEVRGRCPCLRSSAYPLHDVARRRAFRRGPARLLAQVDRPPSEPLRQLLPPDDPDRAW